MISLKGHPVVGSSWEGYIVEQVRQLKSRNIDMYYYRTQAGSEYDIILAKGIHPLACVEVKLNNAPVISKGNMQSIADLKTKKNFVVVPDVEEYKTKDGIIIWTSDDVVTHKKYVAIFNTNDVASNKISVPWTELGIEGAKQIRDLWAKKELGIFNKEFTTSIEAHSCLLISL